MMGFVLIARMPRPVSFFDTSNKSPRLKKSTQLKTNGVSDATSDFQVHALYFFVIVNYMESRICNTSYTKD